MPQTKSPSSIPSDRRSSAFSSSVTSRSFSTPFMMTVIFFSDTPVSVRLSLAAYATAMMCVARRLLMNPFICLPGKVVSFRGISKVQWRV